MTLHIISRWTGRSTEPCILVSDGRRGGTRKRRERGRGGARGRKGVRGKGVARGRRVVRGRRRGRDREGERDKTEGKTVARGISVATRRMSAGLTGQLGS